VARSAFGGGGDYSSLFSSLYAQSKSLKDQQQSAFDKDAYDRWKNGLSTDDEWLTYIQGRVDGTGADKDPTDHQHWIELQRQYVTSIADSQAEFAFKEGHASIGELIGYYQGRLGRLQESGEEYRDVKQHLNDLVDKRDSDDLSTGAQQISAQIDRGKATYEDLLKFYQSHLKGLRSGSELYKQVTSEITKVRGTISDSKLSGQFEKLQYMYESKKISGRAYANQLESMAHQFKASDPAKYYQILQAANRIRQAGGSGGGGGGGGTGSLSKNQRSHEDQLLKVDSYLEGFTAAYKKGARVVPDPLHPGQQIVLTPELMAEIDQQRLGNYDKLATVYKHAGDNSKYGYILEKKTKYIVDYVQPHNTVAASQQWGQLVGALNNTIAANADNADSEATLKKIFGSFQSMQKWLQGEVVKKGKIVSAEDQPTGDFVENSSQFVESALSILGDPNLDSASRAAQLESLASSLETDSGADYDRGTKAAMRDALAHAGAIANTTFDLATGKKVLAITDNGLEPVDVRMQHTLTVDENGRSVSLDLPSPDVQLQQGQRVQEVWIDRGGTPTKVFAVVGAAPSPYQAWVAQKSITLNGKTYKKGAVIPSSALGGSSFQDAVRGGGVARKDAFAAAGSPLSYIQVPAYDDNGQHHASLTWYQDPQTKLWYSGQPPISSASLNADGTVKIGDDGKIAVNWLPYASASGVAAPYVGSNRRAMQGLYDEGQVGTDPRYNQPTGQRDFTGEFTTDPEKSLTTKTPYYDPYDDIENHRTNVLNQAEQPQPTGADIIGKAMREKAAASGGSVSGDFEEQVTKIAGLFGINLGATPGQKSPVPGPSSDITKQRQDTLRQQQIIPRVGLPQGKAEDDIAFPMPHVPTSSGPALANLPSASAGKIDVSKVQAVGPKKKSAAGAHSNAPVLPGTPDPGFGNYPTDIIRKHGGAQEYN
jgi:hypothetical protein